MSAEPPTRRIPFLNKIWLVLWTTLRKYAETDGEQRAASFAYYALFALFPLIVLFVTISSQFVDKAEASAKIIDLITNYIPMGAEGEDAVIRTVSGVVYSRKPIGLFAVVAVVWSSMGFFHSLVRGVNRAWGTLEYPWYRLPFKNLFMVGIVASALFFGIIAPVIIQTFQDYIGSQTMILSVGMITDSFVLAKQLLPWLVLFYAFSMFYKFAPRQHRNFREVWLSALTVTAALLGLRHLFVFYTQRVAHFNVVYGAFGGIIALLMWIYLSGSIIILGGCLSAAQSEVLGKPVEQSGPAVV